MKHTVQAVSALPSDPRVVLDISGEHASAPLSTAVQSIGDARYLQLTGGTLTGALLGTTLGLSGLLTTNGQIAFPATQNPSATPNVLDDYEEGASTPTPTAGIGALTSASSLIVYTKIGNRVSVNGFVTVTNNGTGSGWINLQFPFTTTHPCAFSGRNVATNLAINGTMGSGGSIATFVRYDATYPIATGQDFYFSGSYNT